MSVQTHQRQSSRASVVCVAPERLVAGQAALLENVIEELTAVHVLHDNKQVPSRLPHVMQLHHVGMIDQLQDSYLALHLHQ